MPRYLVERSFPDGLEVPTNTDGLNAMQGLIESNTGQGVSWVRSFVTDDHRKTFCIYDAPTPEAIRQAASTSNLPIDSISAVSVLDPYFYVGHP
jgi:hypothetical protein